MEILKIPFEIFAASKICERHCGWYPQNFTRLNWVEWWGFENEEEAQIIWTDYLKFIVKINSDGRKKFRGSFFQFCKKLKNLDGRERTFALEAIADKNFPRVTNDIDRIIDYVMENWSDPENAIDGAESLWIRMQVDRPA